MKEQCPECGDELDIRDVAPCADCGHVHEFVDVLRQDIAENFSHDSKEYNLYRAYDEVEVILCTACACGLESFAPDFWGYKGKKRLRFQDLEFLRQINEPVIAKDKFCATCKMRLAFIHFVQSVREVIQSNGG